MDYTDRVDTGRCLLLSESLNLNLEMFCLFLSFPLLKISEEKVLRAIQPPSFTRGLCFEISFSASPATHLQP